LHPVRPDALAFRGIFFIAANFNWKF